MFKRTPKAARTKKRTFADGYDAFCYRLLGNRLENDKKNIGIAERLGQANMGVTPGLYIARNLITAIIVGIVSTILYSIVFILMIHSDIWYILVPLLTAICAACAYIIYPLAVMTRISKRAAFIEKELPFTLSELSIMASTGLSRVKIFRKIAKRMKRRLFQQNSRK